MRVIAGTARSLPLKCIEGNATRPTTDRIKETLFNILNPDLPGCRFLDLFAGSGAIGIEALSRGAEYAAFADSGRAACECIEENLRFTHLADRARVFFMDAVGALKVMEGDAPFDFIFLDPPYGRGLERDVLEFLQDSSLADEYTVVILEAALKEDVSWVEQYGFEIKREKKYKTNKHVFMELKAF